MKPNIMKFINQLEGYKTAIKVQHWSSKNMSMHKLFDDIASSVSDIQDMVSEISQGLYGQIKNSELKPISYKINGEQKFLDDILKDSKTFYSTIQKGDDFIGIRSEMETFIGKISQFKYLMNLCLKEDFKRNFKAKLDESKHTIRLSEKELANYITECVQKSLDRIQGKKTL